MKSYFDSKLFLTALIALVAFKILDQLFLDRTVKNLIGGKQSFEEAESFEIENEQE